MLLIFFLLLVLHVPYSIEASDKPLSGRTIKIQGSDQIAKKISTEYPLELVNYSGTVKIMIEDLAASTNESEIPLNQVTAKVFACLIGTFAQELYNKSDTLSDARKKFQELFKEKYPDVTPSDLLIQTNILDINTSIFDEKSKKYRNFKSLIASLYADALKTKSFEITQDNLCDGIPYELEPLVTGWLLHNLFKDMKPEVVQRDFNFSGDVLIGPILSNSGSENGFACVWQQVGGEFSQSATPNVRYIYFDFSKKDKLQEKQLSRNIITDKSQCAISNDGKYIVIVEDNGESPIKLHFYDLLDPQAILYEAVKVLNHFIDDIVTVLFNDKENRFEIIACTSKAQKNAPTIKTFYHYTISLTTFNLQCNAQEDISNPEKAIFHCKDMRWSCVNGKLIGVHAEFDKSNTRILSMAMYHDGKLWECSFDKQKDQWFYKTEKEDTPLDVCIVNTQEQISVNRSQGVNVLDVAIQNSFMPDFQELITPKINSSIQAKFDANHCYGYYIWPQLQKIGITYPGDKRFIQGHMVLNKRVLNGNPKVLIDAFFMHCYHTYPNNWDIICKNILEPEMLVSKDIQEIYNIEEQLKTKKLKSLGWIQALRQGQIVPYAQVRWQSFYSAYKTPVQTGLALGGIGFVAWYFNKYGTKNWLSSLKMQKSTITPHSAPAAYKP